jgi:hypothetical protein
MKINQNVNQSCVASVRNYYLRVYVKTVQLILVNIIVDKTAQLMNVATLKF